MGDNLTQGSRRVGLNKGASKIERTVKNVDGFLMARWNYCPISTGGIRQERQKRTSEKILDQIGYSVLKAASDSELKNK